MATRVGKVNTSFENYFCSWSHILSNAILILNYVAASSDCSQYYWCDKGMAADKYDCGDGLLFDSIEEVCTFADEVKCGEGNAVNAIAPSPTASPSKPTVITATSFPTMTKDKVWSDTASPTISQKMPADPPWLSVTRKDDENSALINSVVICLQLQVFIYLVIQLY